MIDRLLKRVMAARSSSLRGASTVDRVSAEVSIKSLWLKESQEM